MNSDGSDICQPDARQRSDCAFHKALLCRAGCPATNVSALLSIPVLAPEQPPSPLSPASVTAWALLPMHHTAQASACMPVQQEG